MNLKASVAPQPAFGHPLLAQRGKGCFLLSFLKSLRPSWLILPFGSPAITMTARAPE
jgi:hypothetical protein